MKIQLLQFARLYPLNQRDFPLERKPLEFGPLMPRSVKIENPSRDYTDPSESWLNNAAALTSRIYCKLCKQASKLTGEGHGDAEYISLLFTDLGVLTPAAVSDELIQLYV